MTLAAELLTAVGGVENVEALTRCWARLRFTLHDPAAVDEGRVTALPEVVIAVHQHGQYQVALRTGLLATYDDLTTLITEHLKDHHG
jgi:phosphotransferase system IIB component